MNADLWFVKNKENCRFTRFVPKVCTRSPINFGINHVCKGEHPLRLRWKFHANRISGFEGEHTYISDGLAPRSTLEIFHDIKACVIGKCVFKWMNKICYLLYVPLRICSMCLSIYFISFLTTFSAVCMYNIEFRWILKWSICLIALWSVSKQIGNDHV